MNITLTGTGTSTNAVATLSQTGLTFTQPLGTMSSTFKVKITNTGTNNLNVESVSTEPPFVVTQLAGPILLPPGKSANISVSYFGSSAGTTTGSVFIVYDVLPPAGISLVGTTTSPTSMVVTNFPTLPLGTAGFAYLAQLTTARASGNVTWSLAAGSSLPSGLTLSPSGAITGTIPSSTQLTTYTFAVQAMDSKSHIAKSTMSLQVLGPTGASCNDVSWDVGGLPLRSSRSPTWEQVITLAARVVSTATEPTYSPPAMTPTALPWPRPFSL